MDSAHQVIVATRATNLASDKQQAVVMVEEAAVNVGTVPKEVSADAGYYSAKAVDGLHALGVDQFIAPDKTGHGNETPPVPRVRIPKGLPVRDRMRRKLRTKRGRQRYSLRMETVGRYSGRSSRRGGSASSAPGVGEGEPGVAAHLYRPQPAEAVPLRCRAFRQRAGQRWKRR